MKFVIGPAEIRRRNRNILLGLLFSVLLSLVIVVQNHRNPETYSDLLLWSVMGFVVIANVVNYLRHLRYVRLTKEHQLELLEDSLRFHTGSNASELALDDVASVRFFRRFGRLSHIQIMRRDQRGIRLEGYDDLEGLATALRERIPESRIMK